MVLTRAEWLKIVAAWGEAKRTQLQGNNLEERVEKLRAWKNNKITPLYIYSRGDECMVVTQKYGESAIATFSNGELHEDHWPMHLDERDERILN